MPSNLEMQRYMKIENLQDQLKIEAQQRQPAEAELADMAAQLQREIRRRHRAERKIAHLQERLDEEQHQRRRLEIELGFQRLREQTSLSPRRLWDYLRLLWWVVVTPGTLKEYKMDLDGRSERKLKQLSSWLASSLMWWPVLLWVSLPWSYGVLDLTPNVGYGLMAAVAVAWIVTGILGCKDDALSALAAVFTTATVTLVVMAVAAGLVGNIVSENVTLIVALGVVAVILAMVAVTIATIERLAVTDAVSALVAVVVSAGIVFILMDRAIPIFNAAFWIVSAIVMAGYLQERYKEA